MLNKITGGRVVMLHSFFYNTKLCLPFKMPKFAKARSKEENACIYKIEREGKVSKEKRETTSLISYCISDFKLNSYSR